MNCSPDMLSMLKIQPPSNTKTVSESCSMDISPTYSATLTITPADLEAFQQTTNITDWKTNEADVSFFKDKVSGLKSLLSGKYGDGIISEEILIDTSNVQQYTVYFVRSYVD